MHGRRGCHLRCAHDGRPRPIRAERLPAHWLARGEILVVERHCRRRLAELNAPHRPRGQMASDSASRECSFCVCCDGATASHPHRCCLQPPPPPPPPPGPPLPPTSGHCKFEKNMDWNEGARAPQQPATDPAHCCALCHATKSCVASTFFVSSKGQGTCFFKSAKDVAKGLKATTKACVACVPTE